MTASYSLPYVPFSFRQRERGAPSRHFRSGFRRRSPHDFFLSTASSAASSPFPVVFQHEHPLGRSFSKGLVPYRTSPGLFFFLFLPEGVAAPGHEKKISDCGRTRPETPVPFPILSTSSCFLLFLSGSLVFASPTFFLSDLNEDAFRFSGSSFLRKI